MIAQVSWHLGSSFWLLSATRLPRPRPSSEPIEGKWKTASGETAEIASCGGGFCVTLKTGKYAGTQIGKMAGSGRRTIPARSPTPKHDKTYSGSGTVCGNALKMKGC